MNILFLLLSIEIKKSKFLNNNRDIKLLFIEEPEAHTHPQLQYIFARKVEELLGDIAGLQTIITTHSPHIVSNHRFENIRYMLSALDNDNVEIINFHNELKKRYKDEEAEFQFLKQYLSIEASELFFASKIIFIEGVSENILLPYFIHNLDEEKKLEEKDAIARGEIDKEEYIPISSQNVSIMQVGANAQAFRHFIELLKIKTLIITDIDTTKKNSSNRYEACKISDAPENTSNASIKYFYNAPSIYETDQFKDWMELLLKNKLVSSNNGIKINYQVEENRYHARSFEDAFINVNLDLIKTYLDKIKGLKNEDSFLTTKDIYDLTQGVIDKKSDFASSLLYLAHTEKTLKWATPLYLKEGLEWIQR
jgi:predicted ATP-dependent endonuclease of OLD family